jgi:protein-tyrosine-phosphatase
MLGMSPLGVLMALKNILFVCTGNVCRSPMAEGLFRHMVANRPDIRVRSAGVSTFPGQAPSPHAIEVLAGLRIDISKLRSLPLSDELVREASCIIAMTRSHMESIQPKRHFCCGNLKIMHLRWMSLIQSASVVKRMKRLAISFGALFRVF